MIKCKKGEITLKGEKSKLLTDLTCILRAFRENGHFSEEEIEKSISLSRMSEEELVGEASKRFFEMLINGVKEGEDGNETGN